MSSCINLEPHNFQVVKSTWDDFSARGTVKSTTEKMVCTKCGEVIDPFKKGRQQNESSRTSD